MREFDSNIALCHRQRRRGIAVQPLRNEVLRGVAYCGSPSAYRSPDRVVAGSSSGDYGLESASYALQFALTAAVRQVISRS